VAAAIGTGPSVCWVEKPGCSVNLLPTQADPPQHVGMLRFSVSVIVITTASRSSTRHTVGTTFQLAIEHFTQRSGVSQADFFCGKLNGITFPYSSGGIHFVAFFLKLLGTKNSMIFAINHPTCKNKAEAKKFSCLTNLYRRLRDVSPEDIRVLSVMAGYANYQVFAHGYSSVL
jgi:hypothetical protein